MNLVDGATTFPVLVGNDVSLTRSEDAVLCMEAVGQADLAAVVARNLSITRSLRAVDALLLVLHVWEVWNFEWWERSVVAEEVPLGTRTHIPSGHMVNTLWGQTTLDHNVHSN